MKKYTTYMLLILVTPTLLIGLFNWFINPYQLFTDVPQYSGLNLYKPVEDLRQFKAYQVIQAKPDALILGSSRSRLIPIEHASFQGYTSYNLGLNGATGYETFRYLQHAHSVRKIKRVILGIGEDFSAGTMSNFNDERLFSNTHKSVSLYQLQGYYTDVMNALFSFPTLKDSVRTIKQQHEGNYDEFSDKKIKSAIMDFSGQYNLFVDMEKRFLRKIKNTNREGNCSGVVNHDSTFAYEEYTYFYKTVDMAYKENIDLRIFFYPVHSRLYEIYCAAGYWSKVEKTKRAVVNIIDELAIKHNKIAFKVWDFSGYNSITTESYPPANDVQVTMQWYVDPIHYSKKTGKLILDRMFNYTSKYHDFGTLVSAKNIEQHLAGIRTQRRAFARNNTAIVNEINSIVRTEYRKKRHTDVSLISDGDVRYKLTPQL